MSNLSPAEDAFVEALIDLGDPLAAAAVAGVQPSLGRDPHIQSVLVDRLRQQGALDAVRARSILLRIAEKGENDTIRFRAASLLWERGLGKVPDEVNINVNLEHLDRATLHTEIKQLIADLGMPPLIEGDFEEIATIPDDLEARSGAAPPSSSPPPAPLAPLRGATSRTADGEPDAAPYVPALPPKWQ